VAKMVPSFIKEYKMRGFYTNTVEKILGSKKKTG
jgi:hypothetical protein